MLAVVSSYEQYSELLLDQHISLSHSACRHTRSVSKVEMQEFRYTVYVIYLSCDLCLTQDRMRV